jgi:hypothetical protein
MGERIYALTFLVAIAIPIALAIVTGSPGIHSTPGIWLMVLGLPGTIIGLWTESGFGGNPLLFYIAMALSNGVLYLLAIKGVLLSRAKTIVDGVTRPHSR